MSERGYQFGFSDAHSEMFNRKRRTRKAATIVDVLKNHYRSDLKALSVLDIGGSAGIIDDYLAEHCGQVVGIDIDSKAVASAQQSFQRNNLRFMHGDALRLEFPDSSFDVVVCAQIYEHVPKANVMMDEIYRVLKPEGVCYFAASNRLMLNEPHYNLPFLSVVPRSLASLYLRATGKGTHYHELHYSYWGLCKLVAKFSTHDYTRKIIEDPESYGAAYMLPAGSLKLLIARIVAGYFYWAVPGYVWLLEKPKSGAADA